MTTTVTTGETVVKERSSEAYLDRLKEVCLAVALCISLINLGYRAGLEEASRNESNRSD